MRTALVDLSAIYWRMWHGSEGEEMSSAKRNTLGFVRELFDAETTVKVALDCPPYDRKKLYPEYKANRSEKPIGAVEKLKETVEELKKDGWSVLTCDGAEADDIIGSYVTQNKDEKITIYGTDKDLLQVVDGERVNLYDAFNKKFKTPHDTFKGLSDTDVCDVLALAGDKSDNIPGIPRVGIETAIKIVKKWGNIDYLIARLKEDPEKVTSDKEDNPIRTQKQVDTILDNLEQLMLSFQLVTLNCNCEIKEEKREVNNYMEEEKEETIEADFEEEKKEETKEIERVVEPVLIEPLSYRQSLAPQGMNELARASKMLFDSRLYSNFSNAQAIAAAVMAGREFGLGPIASLSSIHIIKGKPTMSGQGMLALCKGSDKCEYFDLIETTSKIATFETRRIGSKNASKLSFTIEDAESMRLTNLDQWKKQPATMLRWRCVAALARLVYPDVILGVYTPEELES